MGLKEGLTNIDLLSRDVKLNY